MAVYELKIENFKDGGMTDIFYLIPDGNDLQMYKMREEKGLEKIAKDIEIGWKLYSGGLVNLRTLTDNEEQGVFGLVQKMSLDNSL